MIKTKLFIPIEEIESSAIDQIKAVEALPIVDGQAIMPDCHWGNGATVGSVIACRKAVIPAAVGVDIGCGMVAVKTNLTANILPDSLADIRSEIESVVPVGFNEHKTRHIILNPNDALKLAHKDIGLTFNNLNAKVRSDKFRNQIGTLGGGNHFIELCLDKEGNVWIMLHSGSRNVGKEIAEMHISLAKGLAVANGITGYHKDLAWFEDDSKEFHKYWHDVRWAQKYAFINRWTMLHNILEVLKGRFPKLDIDVINQAVYCHHNYISQEVHNGENYYITRKGAVSAEKDQLGIIPGSMGTKSYIVKGKGNVSSYNSCSHGAGRRMSRGAAKKKYTVADLKQQTEGVECRKDKDIIDEIPGAYKDIDRVMELQNDLIEVVAELRAMICIKG